MGRSKASSLRKALKDQGRTVAWLAERTGYSRPYVSSVLSGRHAFTEEFQRRALAALDAAAVVPTMFRGRSISVPKSVYAVDTDLAPIVVESAYEEAWKRSWLAEHAPTVLAREAERAWQAAKALAA